MILNRFFKIIPLILMLFFVNVEWDSEGVHVGVSSDGYERTNSNSKLCGKPGQVRRVGAIEFIEVPSGTFNMGSGMNSNEKPIHLVSISSFLMSKYEITQKQYEEIMQSNPSETKGKDLPVEQVSWEEALEFCKKFSKRHNVSVRLPYEAEWEYACRAGTKTEFYWGDTKGNAIENAWFSANSSDRKPKQVGKKKPNAFGFYDMSGNVSEWCMDWYDKKYYKKSPKDDPKGPENGDLKVFRGGGWSNGANFLRSASRQFNYPGNRDQYLGFRIVMKL